MNKQEKLAALGNAMTTSKRDDGTKYTHFTENAPEELTDLFLEHYEVKDVDYQTFASACDIVREVYEDKPETTDDEATEEIYERASDCASVYTSDRLAYLNMRNEDEVSETMREYGMTSIAEACAAWYDRQVEQAAIIIKDWINA